MSERTAIEVLREIAKMPLSKHFDPDDPNGNGYGPVWAAWHFQETAREWLRVNGEVDEICLWWPAERWGLTRE